jgi:PII-like signaling protein
MPENRTVGSVAGKKLTVFTCEEQRYDDHPLHDSLVRELRQAGVRNVSVTRGRAGFGKDRRLSTTSIEVLAASLPVTIEATDSTERIDRALPRVLEIMEDGLVEVMPVRIVGPVRQTPTQ